MHGAKKLGLFGAGDLQSTLAGMHEHGGIPVFIGYLVVLAETVGAISLILGFMTRFMAASISSVMIGAALVHQPQFFMNWWGTQSGEGYEFHLLAIAIGIALVINGGGAISLDGNVFQKSRKRFGNGLYH